VASLRELLASSVALRLRSDVAVGTSLSGGVDSSAMVALVGAAGLDQRRHSFTARFPGFERDEWRYASAAAAAAGVAEHHMIEPTAGRPGARPPAARSRPRGACGQFEHLRPMASDATGP
jgi:asparagine synthetase B (glutamine-hydrolysing)